MAKCSHNIITDGCRSCQELQAKWYKRLGEDFEDAESLKYPDRPLKVWHRNALATVTSLEIQITHDYYEKALELLHSFHFENKTLRRIWELHCEGCSSGEIERKINHFSISYRERHIRNIIKQFEREIVWSSPLENSSQALTPESF